MSKSNIKSTSANHHTCAFILQLRFYPTLSFCSCLALKRDNEVTAMAESTIPGALAIKMPVVPKPNARIFPVSDGPVIAPNRPKEIALPTPGLTSLRMQCSKLVQANLVA